MSCSDLDILIDGFTRYSYCPLHWAIRLGNVKFVEVMIRTPFDFNTLHLNYGGNVLRKTDEHRHFETVKLILKHAEEKKFDLTLKSKLESLLKIAVAMPSFSM